MSQYEYSLGDIYRPPSMTRRVAPWAIAEVVVNGIKCRCYQDAPREEIVRTSVPYSMEILNWLGPTFVCSCMPDTNCPESVHQGASTRDPWRQRRCQEWREGRELSAAAEIASQGFRDQVTEQVLNVAGITGLQRRFAKGAEFVQVLEERERRERPIKVIGIGFLALAAATGTWFFIRSRIQGSDETE